MGNLDLTNFPGNTIVVDPPRVAAHRNPYRQKHLEARRQEHHEERFERTPLARPVSPHVRRHHTPAAEHDFIAHPLAERAGRDSQTARPPWIQQLKTHKFLRPTGTASVIASREAVRRRIEREKNLEPSRVNAVGGGAMPDGRIFGPPRHANR
jgi:hypothetical protein